MAGLYAVSYQSCQHDAGKHVLKGTAWRSKLCVPDPCLTFTEAEELAKGKSAANQKIAEMVTRLTS